MTKGAQCHAAASTGRHVREQMWPSGHDGFSQQPNDDYPQNELRQRQFTSDKHLPTHPTGQACYDPNF